MDGRVIYERERYRARFRRLWSIEQDRFNRARLLITLAPVYPARANISFGWPLDQPAAIQLVPRRIQY